MMHEFFPLHATIARLREIVVKAIAAADEDEESFRPDPGCLDCTSGVTPDKYNTGLCWYHAGKQFLRETGDDV